MRKFWILLGICLLGAYFTWRDRPINHPPGIVAPQQPLQETLAEAVPDLEKNGYHIKPLAHFEVEARVLLKKGYRFDRGADVSPLDLTLGWGRMSDTAVLEQLDMSQGGRFYTWRAAVFPIPRQEIETHSANMHMIPATEAIEHRLQGVRPGNIVKVSGYLVEVRGDDGSHWRSSLTRDDTGNGACELVWVEDLRVY